MLKAKKILTILIIASMLLTVVPTGALAAKKYEAEVSILGTAVAFKSPAYREGGRIFVPLEEMCEYINLELKSDNGIYTVTRDSQVAKLERANFIATVNDKEVEISASPVVVDEVTYIPIDALEQLFGIPVNIDTEKNYADIKPNTYSIDITSEDAYGVSYEKPNNNTLITDAEGADELYYNNGKNSEYDKIVYYVLDFSKFKGKKIKSASLEISLAGGKNLYANFEIARTDMWDKDTISYENQPAAYTDGAVRLQVGNATYPQGGKVFLRTTFDITSMAKSAISNYEPMSVKLYSIPNGTSTASIQAYIKGVNTSERPKLVVTTEELYNFPIDSSVGESHSLNQYNSVNILGAIGVISEDEELPLGFSDILLTRGEFITYAMKLFGDKVITSSDEQLFDDVTPDMDCFKAVSMAHAYGIVKIGEDKLFNPFDDITFNEAVTILCRMLNHDEYAERLGGYPSGYATAAYSCGLLKGVSYDEYVTYTDAFTMFTNALDVPMFDIDEYDSEGVASYSLNENKTILTENFDCEIVQGTVTANNFSAVTGSVTNNHICIDKIPYLSKNKDYNKLLGYEVKAYINKDNELVYMGTVSTIETSIDLTKIVDVEKSGSDIDITYEDGSQERIVTVSSNDAFIYNLMAVSDSAQKDKELFIADAGEVYILDNDTVIINAYETVVVSYVNKDEQIIHDLYDTYNDSIRLNNFDDFSFVNTDGETMDYASIKSDNVISIAYSLDKTMFRAIVSDEIVNAEITEIAEDDTSRVTVVVAGKEYALTNYYDDDLKPKEWTKSVELGAPSSYFIDAFGQIAGIRVNIAGEYPGYLLGIDKNSKSSLDDTLYAAIVTQNAVNYVTIELAERVTIDGQLCKTSTEVLSLSQLYEGTAFKKQGVIYTLNNEGKIRSIDTSYVNSAKEDGEETLNKMHHIDYTKNTDTPSSSATYADQTKSHLHYKSETGTLSNRYWITDGKSLVIMAPTDSGGYYPTGDFSEYRALNNMENDDKHFMDIYTIGSDSPDVSIAFYRGSVNVGASDGFKVYDRIIYRYNQENGDVDAVLKYYDSPGECKEVVIEEGYLSTVNGMNLSCGDVIRIGVDYNNEVRAVERYFDYATKTITQAEIGHPAAANAVNSLYTKKSIDGFKQFVTDFNDDADTQKVWIKNSYLNTIYAYRATSGGINMYQSNIDDIVDYDTAPYASTAVFYLTNYLTVQKPVIVVPIAAAGSYKAGFVNDAPDTVITDGEGKQATLSPQYRNPGEALDNVNWTLTRPNDTFIGWEYKGVIYKNDELSSIKMPEDNITLTARWKTTRKVAFMNSEGTALAGEAINGVAGQKIILPSRDIESFRITGWTDGANTWNVGDEFTIPDNDVTLYAVGTPVVTYTVSFTNKYGTAPTGYTREENTYTDELPDMDDVDFHTFKGWKLNTATYQVGDKCQVTGNITLEAVWEWSPLEKFWIDHIGDMTTKIGDGVVFTATENDVYTYNSQKFIERCRIKTGSVTIKVNLLEGESGIYDLYLYNKSNSSTRKGVVTIGGEKIGEVATVFESSTLEGRPVMNGPVSVQLAEGENQIVITSSDGKQYDFYGFKLVYAGE